MINYKCSKCGAELESDSSLAGQKDTCPLCRQVCTVPESKGRMPLILGICGGGVAVVVLVVAVVWLWPPGNESAGPPGEQLSRAPLAVDPKPKVEPKLKLTTKPTTKAAKPPTPKVRGPAEYLTLDLGEGVTMTLVLVPAGTFMMGSPETEEGRAGNEGPQRKVTITKPFYMGVYEVTQEQYEQIVGKNPAKFKGAKNPVEQVSWNEAVAFCKALSKKTGRTVRLSTEAEWEYACRAGTKTAFCFGDDEKQLGDYAWYYLNSGNKTHPVGQKKPNAWGLYDMHGNTWEWCSDWYGKDYYANAKAVDPQGPASGSERVVRCGSWLWTPRLCRAACRFKISPGFRYYGFRAVVEVD